MARVALLKMCFVFFLFLFFHPHRYYYLSAERLPVGIRIVDIGIKLHKEPDAHENDHALLGAIHLQAGIPAHRDRLLQRTVLVFDRPE